MIIGQSKNLNKETNDEYIILSFELTIILLKISHVTYLTSLFSANPKIFVCFLDKVKEDVHFEARGIEEMPNYSYFQIEITNFKKEIALIARYYEFNQIFDIIMPYISGYLIKKSYLQINYNRMLNFISYKENFQPTNDTIRDDYIVLRELGFGASGFINLIYHIEEGKLFALKNHSQNDAIFRREKNNYLNFKSPFVPQFHGTVKDSNLIIISKELSLITKM